MQSNSTERIVKTRGGFDVIIFRDDVNHPVYKIVGALIEKDGTEVVHTWTKDGFFREGATGVLDLLLKEKDYA